MRRWSIFAVGIGIGLFAGAQLASSKAAETALWVGAVASVIGMVTFVASGSEQAGAEPAAPGGNPLPGGPVHGGAGVGQRVDQVLRLAEEQAEDLLREARRKAHEVHARAEADLWVVWRQDDHGNRFEVARVESRGDADALAATMEARGHKQLYWVAAVHQPGR
jgi:hypothetical protein